MSSYSSIRNPVTALVEEKRSKFYAYAYAVQSEQEVKNYIAALKIEHPEARHFCYAFRLGASKSIWKVSDAGEPTNSAGMPILGQIKSLDLSDIAVVVVRHFGGVKLGVGGLFEAYKQAAREVLIKAEIVAVKPQTEFQIQTGYDVLNTVLHLVRKFEGNILSQQLEESCCLAGKIDSEQVSIFSQKIRNIKDTKLIL